jgi:hypothetical protein
MDALNTTTTSSYGGYIILSIMAFLAFFLYLYSSQIIAWWKSTSGTVNEYPIIKGQQNLTQEFGERMTIGELLGGAQILNIPDKGRAITITLDLHMNNTVSNDGWVSSYLSLKPIIKVGESPALYYSPKNSKLILVVKYRDNPYYPHYQNIEVDFPLQKWTSILINVDNRDVRFTMDGTLVKFVKLDNTAIVSNDYSDIVSVGEVNNNIQGSIRGLSISL